MEITITNVHKRYGDVVALAGPSFTIPSGSTFGVLGTNGAGKTTLFELLVGHDRPDRGTITVGGIDVATSGHRVRNHVAFLPEHSGFPSALTGREVLSVHARIRNIAGRANRIQETLDMVGLSDAADRSVAGYSNGMGRRLGLATTLLDNPPVLVLDEPTAGLDPRGVGTFHEIIESINRDMDTTVVLSSHALAEVQRLCDEVAILEEGHLRAIGSVDDLRSAVAGTVTVSITSSTNRHILQQQLDSIVYDSGTISVSGKTFTIECDRSIAFELCSSIDFDTINQFEIQEAGLETVFNEAVAGNDVSPETVGVMGE